MKKVLLASEKHGVRIFDISTEELRNAAYSKLFNERDKERYYADLSRVQSQIYFKAKQGDLKSIISVINIRSDYQYERIDEEDVEQAI